MLRSYVITLNNKKRSDWRTKSYGKLVNGWRRGGSRGSGRQAGECVRRDDYGKGTSGEDQCGGTQGLEGALGSRWHDESGHCQWSSHPVYPRHSSPPARPTGALGNVKVVAQSVRLDHRAFTRCRHDSLPAQVKFGIIWPPPQSTPEISTEGPSTCAWTPVCLQSLTPRNNFESLSEFLP